MCSYVVQLMEMYCSSSCGERGGVCVESVRVELQLCPVVLPGIFWEVYGGVCK